MRTASVRSSANDPRPEPRTSPICGGSLVCESTKAAADSARANKSGDINTHVTNTLKLLLKLREGFLQLPLHASALICSKPFLTFFGHTITRRLVVFARRAANRHA